MDYSRYFPSYQEKQSRKVEKQRARRLEKTRRRSERKAAEHLKDIAKNG